MIITVGGIKGGSGKTTVATNLAVWLYKQSKEVLLIDADSQNTTTKFYMWRTKAMKESGFACINLVGDAVRANIELMKKNYDHIIIDAGGTDTTSQRSALVTSDVYLLPFQPKSFDIWTIEEVEKLLAEIRSVRRKKLIAIGFLSRADFRSSDNRESINFFKDRPSMVFLEEQLSNRKAFSNASGSGLSVLELKPKDKKAIKEIEELFNAITNEVLKQV